MMLQGQTEQARTSGVATAKVAFSDIVKMHVLTWLHGASIVHSAKGRVGDFSVTGMVILWNNVVLTTQKSVSLSSAESGFNAAVSTACDAMYMRTLGTKLLRLLSDSSACRGVVARRGARKIKHLEGRLLWIQGRVCAGEISCACSIFCSERGRPDDENFAKAWDRFAVVPRHSCIPRLLNVADEDGIPATKMHSQSAGEAGIETGCSCAARFDRRVGCRQAAAV